MANLIKTPNKAISCVSGESTKELEEIGNDEIKTESENWF